MTASKIPDRPLNAEQININTAYFRIIYREQGMPALKSAEERLRFNLQDPINETTREYLELALQNLQDMMKDLEK